MVRLAADPAILAFESEFGVTVLACSIAGGLNRVMSALTADSYYHFDHNTGTYIKEDR